MKFLLIICTALLLGLSACKDDVTDPGSDSPPANQVWMRGNTFVPASITVESGTTITWVNKDGVLHTTTSSAAPPLFDSGNMSRDETFTYTFESTGTYSYLCKLHPGMTGTVIVQ
jgi:plastocyanin